MFMERNGYKNYSNNTEREKNGLANINTKDGIHKETIQKALKKVNSDPVPRVLYSVSDNLRLSLSVTEQSFNIIYHCRVVTFTIILIRETNRLESSAQLSASS